MVRISLRSPLATSNATEWVSFCVLTALALVSMAAALEHIRVASRPSAMPATHTIARLSAKPAPATLPVAAALPQPAPVAKPAAPPLRAAARVPARVNLRQIAEASRKKPELAKMTRIVNPPHDKNVGEADRIVSARTATVIGRLKDLPLLQDGEAFETWGGEYAKGDSRLKEMIQAGALSSVRRGAKVRVLEVRGALTCIEVAGQGQRGWIRSSYLGR